MLSILAGLGAGPKLAKFIAYFALPALLLLGLYLALDAWGDSRFRAGDAHRDAIWKAASDKVIKAAAESSNAATRNEVPRLLEQQARVEKEKDAIDAAISNGSSLVDALFPTAGNGL